MRLRKKSVEVNYREEETKTFSKKSDWNWKDFVKDTNWFATVCNLPSAPGGLIPVQIPSEIVSMKELVECFTRGLQGFKLNPSMFIPVADLREIVGIVDGPGNLRRNRMDIPMAKGIYADRILGLSVNWALYAHHKHKEQLQRAWRSGRSPPRESPLVRVPIWYSRPPPLNRNGNEKCDFVPPLNRNVKCDFGTIDSGPPAYGDTGNSTSIEIIGYTPCRQGMGHSQKCDSLKSDAAADTQRCSNEADPVDEVQRCSWNAADTQRCSNEADPVDEVPDAADTQRCSNEADPVDKVPDPVERPGPEPDHIPVIDENIRTETPPDRATNLSLISMLTPERIQREISDLTWQQNKLQQDISILRSILAVVSRKD